MILARVERLLWIAGLAGASLGAVYCAEGLASQNVAARIEPVQAGGSERAAAGESGVMGRLEIPDLALSVAILADYDPESLRRGVGHIRGTAMPGGLGTVGLAGHRDTYFRPLRRLTAKMEIRLIDKTGVYHYAVDSTEVVTPDKVDVLAIDARPELTLITCFPFDYIGAAPKRFIVHAHLLSASPDVTMGPGTGEIDHAYSIR